MSSIRLIQFKKALLPVVGKSMENEIFSTTPPPGNSVLFDAGDNDDFVPADQIYDGGHAQI